ncbi:hypothetical protein Hanom_Chr04g00313401 [Helianthus anomalus]
MKSKLKENEKLSVKKLHFFYKIKNPEILSTRFNWVLKTFKERFEEIPKTKLRTKKGLNLFETHEKLSKIIGKSKDVEGIIRWVVGVS